MMSSHHHLCVSQITVFSVTHLAVTHSVTKKLYIDMHVTHLTIYNFGIKIQIIILLPCFTCPTN